MANHNNGPFNTVFFDMDGVLIFSEPYWREAEDRVFKRRFGIDLTDEDVHQSTGLKTTEVVDLHKVKYGIECNNEEIGFEIEKEVVRQVNEKGQPMNGLRELTDWIDRQGWRRCLVTSSSQYVYDHLVKFVGLEHFFEKKFTAYDETHGKPNPAVYLSAIRYMNVPTENILVIEDSMNGVKAAHAAGLKIYALPEEQNRKNPEYLSYVDGAFGSHYEILAKLAGDNGHEQMNVNRYF